MAYLPAISIIQLLLFLLSVGALLQVADAFSVERKNLIGVWKLELDSASQDSLQSRADTITIKLQDDGSFQQFDEDASNKDFLEGCWDLEDSQLQLAFKTCRADTLLSGKMKADGECKGQVSAGKFMYPQTHAAFFDQVMAAADVVGKFSLRQVMAFHKIIMPTDDISKQKKEPQPTYQKEDFFGKEFIMTVVPIECKVKPQDLYDKEKRQWTNPLDNQAVDIRTLPIQFFANSTFQAIGVNKILRGRFEVTEDDKLWFAVSRFGLGRSTPGSVYSEGTGLSHEDERSYTGPIEMTANGSFRVEGKVTFGADLGSDARPEPVGTFILHGVDEPPIGNSDSDTTDDDIFSSVFE